MPPKKTIPKGELTAPELRKLIRAHNILSKITIPKGTDREGLIKLIEGKNYKIDHKNKVIKPQVKRGKQISLKQAEELTKPKPVSEEVKKQRAEKKKEKEEEKKKEIKIAKKEAVQEFKKKQKEAKKKIKKSEKLNAENDLKLKSIVNNKKDMGETAFIKQQKKLQLQKQKETRRALLKSKPPVDKTTRRGKPVKKEEEKKKSDKKEILKSEKKPAVKKGKGGDPINKLTGPEAEELVDKLKPLLESSKIMGWTGEIRSVYNMKERKQLIKDLMNDNLKKNITKEEKNKFSPLYIPTPIGIKKYEKNQYSKGGEEVEYVKYKVKEGGYQSYTLHPQLYTDTIFGREIKKWDITKIRDIIQDYLKGDIGTKKKEVKKPLEVKDFTIIMKGKNYNKEEFLKWVDTKGYKFSKQQLEKLNMLVVSYNLQSFRNYYNSNGVLVLVPTLKFNASTKVYNPETKKYEYVGIGEVLSELAGERGGSILKLELKPKEKIELTPEKIKEYDMTRLKFNAEELPTLKKSKEENENKLKVYEKEYDALHKEYNKEEMNKKGVGTFYSYLSQERGLRVIDELQESKAKKWFVKTYSKYLGEGKREEIKVYAPQPVREWYEKNVKDIQKLNLIQNNLYNTIRSYENKDKQLKKKYNIE